MEEKIPTDQPGQQVLEQTPVAVPEKRGGPLRIAILIVAILLVVAGGVYAVRYFTRPKVCTLEAKICPDGSVVGRVLPNCEFAPCPTFVPTVTTAPTSDETANWKTYRNEKYGFEFKYPEIWYKFTEDVALENNIIVISLVTTPPQNAGDLSGIEIANYFNPQNLSLIDWWRKQNGSGDYSKDVESKYLFKTTIDSLPALRQEPDAAPEDQEMTEIFILRNKTVFRIRATNNITKQDVSKKIFDQILSTFKFLD